MDGAAFAARYDPSARVSWASTPATEAVLAEAEDWAHLFGEHLHAYLSGRDPLTPAESLRLLTQYNAWNLRAFVGIVRALELLGDERGVSAMHFHTLSHNLLWSWRAILDGRTVPTTVDRRRAQTLLAVHAGNMLTTRERTLEWRRGENGMPPPAGIQGGMLTETDAAITILELIRARRELVLVAAPPQFEAAGGRGNVDLLLVRTTDRRVLGIQVKTRLRNDARQRYDDVAFIDGTIDLGNQRRQRLPRSSASRTVAWPGLIAAHHLMNVNDRLPLFARWAEVIRARREGLRETLYGTDDYLPRAMAQLRGRLLGPFDDAPDR